MTSPDLNEVERVAGVVHVEHPEDAAVFRERLALYPAGCFVLEDASGVRGYVISHPWLLKCPPSLNTLLGSLPAMADTMYLHDLAVMPTARAGGAGTGAIDLVAAQARRERIATLSLLAVGRSQGFWQKNGFQPATVSLDLSSYGIATYMTRPVPQNPNM